MWTWYINLEHPLKRAANGFDFEDQLLDATVTPDLRCWQWQDEDELEEAVSAKLITRTDSIGLYELGRSVVSDLQ
jgi:predicted RNA-binding protein associated with RNAse of E/G family